MEQYLYKPNIEIEYVFGLMTNNGFKPGVHKDVFYNVKRMFDSTFEATYELSIDLFKENIRETYVNDELKECVSKKKLYNTIVNDHVIVNVKREPRASRSSEKPSYIRKKERWSYFHKYWRYDFTIVNGNTYEIELEVLTIPSRRYSKEYIQNDVMLKVNQLVSFIRQDDARRT
jgi:hypothetical protein